MTDTLKHIYLSWRKGRSSRRHLVGLLSGSFDNQIRFSYLNDGVERASLDGFRGYTEFSDFNKQYELSVLDVFAQRLTPSGRLSTSHTAKFWGVPTEKLNDKWLVLAYTQGLLSTDNFELLADFEPHVGLSFISDLAGLSYNNVPVDLLQKGDHLEWKLEVENEYDPNAVLVSKGDQKIGYIKKVHCNIFHKWPLENIKLSVHEIERNGIVKNVFIKVVLI